MTGRSQRQTGLPRRIVLDEAHYLIARQPSWMQDDTELRGQTLVTYRLSTLAEMMHVPEDAVILVTKETDRQEIASLRTLCKARRRTGVRLL